MITLTLDTTNLDNVVHRGMTVLQRLQKAGVPAVGVLGVETVERGVLMVSAPDIASGEITYTWKDENE